MKTRTFIQLFIVIFISFSLLVSCSQEKSPITSLDKPLPISIRLAWVHDMAEIGIFVAKEKGFYSKEGLDLKIEPGGFGLDPFKLVAAGTNDFGVGGAGNLILAREKDVPVVAIAAEFQNTPVGFLTKADSGITAFINFRGKKVGVQTGTDTDVLYQALLTKNGMLTKDVKEVPIQYDMAPFLSGQIDVLPGYITNQPIQLANKGFKTNVITAKSQGLSYYGNIYFVTEKTTKDRPDVVKRFLRATYEGWLYAFNNKKDAIAALKIYTKDFDDKDLDKFYDAVMPFIKPDESNINILGMSQEKWKSTHDVLKKAKLSTKSELLDGIYNTQFLPQLINRTAQ